MFPQLSTEEIESLLEPIALPESTRYTNWSNTYHCVPAAIFEPLSEHQCELILELARRRKATVRATGVGHSPNDVACSSGYLVRTLKLNALLEVNIPGSYVWVQGGMTLAKLHDHLDRHGLAMSNIGSISDQTVAGVTTIATHGTGLNFKVIPTYVMAMDILLADGRRIRCSREEHKDFFLATLCGFGATGFVLSVKLKVEPAFRLRERQEVLPFPTILSALEDVAQGGEHVRIWWFPSTDKVVLHSSDRVYQPACPRKTSHFYGYLSNQVVQLCLLIGIFVPCFVRLAGFLALRLWFGLEPQTRIDLSHKVFNLDCKYKQYTTEWAIPYENTSKCLQEMRDWINSEFNDTKGLRVHFPIEVRFSDEDDIFLSPSFGRKTCWIGVVQHKPYGFPVPYRKLFHTFETIVQRHSGRPHWSKAHSLGPREISRSYPRFSNFVDVLQVYDPHGIFRNEYVRRHIFGEQVDLRVFKLRRAVP